MSFSCQFRAPRVSYLISRPLKNVGAWRGPFEPSVRYVLHGAGAAVREPDLVHLEPAAVHEQRGQTAGLGTDGRPTKNGAGGVNGGLTNGAPLTFRVAFKPTSSIAKPQQTFNFATGEMDTLSIKGRHDACFALRCPVIVEAMTAIALADLALLR